MLKLRLKRVGRKHDPSFRIVVTESTNPAKGKYKEAVGFYNPRLKQLQLDKDRIKYWLSNGIQPTDVVHNLLVKEGLLDAPKVAVHSRKPSRKKAAEAEEKAKAEDAPSKTPDESASEDASAEEAAPQEEAPKEEPKDDAPAEDAPKEEDTEEEKKEE